MNSTLVLTQNVISVLKVFLRSPEQPQYGYLLVRSTSVGQSTTHAILKRLEGAGWVREVGVEDSTAGGPARVLYALVPEMLPTIEKAVEDARKEGLGGDGPSAEEAALDEVWRYYGDLEERLAEASGDSGVEATIIMDAQQVIDDLDAILTRHRVKRGCIARARVQRERNATSGELFPTTR